MENIFKKTIIIILGTEFCLYIFLNLSTLLSGKRDIDGRLAGAQNALQQQEETVRRAERERKQMADKLNNLEHSLANAEADKALLQVVLLCINKLMNKLMLFSFLISIKTVISRCSLEVRPPTM